MPAFDLKDLMQSYPRALPLGGAAVVLTGLLLAFTSADENSGDKQAATTTESAVKTQQVASAAPAASTPALDRGAVEGIVRDYLMKNPEILLEVQQALETKMSAERDKQAKVALAENASQIFRSEADPFIGNKQGDVTVVEFFDYNCGFCRRAVSHLTGLVDSDKNVKVVLKEMPIFGEESEQAAYAALAAGKQGKYWEMHRALLEKPGRANKEKALGIARELQLDIAKLEADMQLPEIKSVVSDTQKLAQAMGIQGTPHFLVGPETIPGAPDDLLDQIKTRIKKVRKDGCTVC